MAISKILHMKEGGGGFKARHLKHSLDYVMNPEKTQGGRLVGAVNCQADTAYKQMAATKQKFGKTDSRQGYHIILSFKEDEAKPDMVYEITQKFVEEYLGKRYEAVFVVHDNTSHVHSHIIFNSVSFLDGRKYRYEKGDWVKNIQPITNGLCERYGLSVIDIEDGSREKQQGNYRDWKEQCDSNFVWSDMIKRDVDACILQADSFGDFIRLIREKGYEVKQGKYLAIRPPGMGRFRRCRTLGDDYGEERIKERIREEDLSFYLSSKKEVLPQLVMCRIKRYRRAKLSGLQKKYYAKLYRTGQLKKRPYSQAWKYKDDIRRMHELQEQYLFLARHGIHSADELAAVIANLTDKKKEASSEKGRAYRAKAGCSQIFEKAAVMEKLIPAEQSFQNGDDFFRDEHGEWQRLSLELQSLGYTYEEAAALRQACDSRYSKACSKEKAVYKELKLGEKIFRDIYSGDGALERGQDMQRSRATEYDRKDKPDR